MKLKIRGKTGKLGQFQIYMGRTTHSKKDGSQEYSMHLRVEECISGQVLIDVDLSSEQVVHLLGGGLVTVDSRPIPHPERIGRQLEIGSITVQPRASPAARKLLLQKGWDEVSVTPQNTGDHHVVAFKWV